jgi:multicomponent Na+:H+ antiporter subunit F
MSEAAILAAAVRIAMVLLLLGLLCAFVRMVIGPSRADRIVALDMVSLLLVSFAGVSAVGFDEAAFLDAATVLALVAFLGTVAFARYLERRHRRAAEDPGGEPTGEEE